jgi:Fe-S-cluster-containing dehydrogenase component
MRLFDRRAFLKFSLAAGAGTALPPRAEGQEDSHLVSPDYVGVLVDTTLCIGCRKCEEACNRRNSLPRTAEPFSDREALRNFRRPTESAYTVVNQFPGSPSPDQAGLPMTFVKVQCMHCLIPSCVSACIVGALTKAPDGAVVYNPTICIGCRYCMVACPFEIPAYEYDTPLTPRVRKCQFCADRAKGTGANPACAAACPTESLVFGKRADLLAIAHKRLEARPDRYIQHVYGENEVGGTGWLYLTGRPVAEIGLFNLPKRAPALRTEAIQHGIFKYGILPVAFYGTLAGIMWYNRRRGSAPGQSDEPPPPAPRHGPKERGQ